MTLIKRHLHPNCPLMKVNGALSPSCPRSLASLLFFVGSINSNGNKIHFKSWHSSAAIIGAMQLTTTDSHFVLEWGNLGLKNFEISWEVAIRTFERLSVNSSAVHKSSFFGCKELRFIRMRSFKEVCHTRLRHCCLSRRVLFFSFQVVVNIWASAMANWKNRSL